MTVAQNMKTLGKYGIYTALAGQALVTFPGLLAIDVMLFLPDAISAAFWASDFNSFRWTRAMWRSLLDPKPQHQSEQAHLRQVIYSSFLSSYAALMVEISLPMLLLNSITLFMLSLAVMHVAIPLVLAGCLMYRGGELLEAKSPTPSPVAQTLAHAGLFSAAKFVTPSFVSQFNECCQVN